MPLLSILNAHQWSVLGSGMAVTSNVSSKCGPHSAPCTLDGMIAVTYGGPNGCVVPIQQVDDAWSL